MRNSTVAGRNVIVRGASWTTLAQLAPVVVNIALTPHLIAALGKERYGLYLLCFAVLAFFSSFDGGISNSMVRWSAIYAGQDDRRSNTRLVTSMFVVVTILGCVLFALLSLGASFLLSAFGASPRAHDEGVFMLRCMAVVLGVSQVRGLFGAQLSARQRFGLQSVINMLSYVVFAVGVLITIDKDLGLRGIGLTFLAQAFFVTVVLVPAGCRYLDIGAVGFLPRHEVWRFLTFSMKVQGIGLTSLITNQTDTLIIGRFLSLNAVAVFGTGANFANQLRNVFMNALPPMTSHLSKSFGQGGHEAVLAQFGGLQRRWVQAVAAWCSVGSAAAYFGVERWLGSDFRLAGVVSAVMLASYAFTLWTGALVVLLSTAGHPEIELRYAVVAVIINLTLTAPLLVAFGLIGTVAATAAGSIMASLYLVRLARRGYHQDIPSFLNDIPILPMIASAAVVVALELIATPLMPSGALGLLASGVLAIPGFAVFLLALLGPRTTIAVIIRQWRTLRDGPPSPVSTT